MNEAEAIWNEGWSEFEYEVEEIVMMCEIAGFREYLILWKDGTETWEPEENLTHCEDLLRAFHENK